MCFIGFQLTATSYQLPAGGYRLQARFQEEAGSRKLKLD